MGESIDLRERLGKVPKGHYRIVNRTVENGDHPSSQAIRSLLSNMVSGLSKRSHHDDKVVDITVLTEGGNALMAITLVGDKRGWLR